MVDKRFASFVKSNLLVPQVNILLDYSRFGFTEAFLKEMEGKVEAAFQRMAELEGGSIANPTENRLVGHYWLRKPELSPKREIKEAIESSLASIATFSKEEVRRFKKALIIGIGGSALGPQLLAGVFGNKNGLPLSFLDNTDPFGIESTLQEIGYLDSTLVVVTSKSGSTPETRNGMMMVREAFSKAGLNFADHAVAITGVGSELDKVATREKWLKRFSMWDWVGGRTSIFSAVGLLPGSLLNIDISSFLAGGAFMDEATRLRDVYQNPAMILALSWYLGTNGTGQKALVVLPYCDRLMLFSRYLQQLVMESLGKESDLSGNTVNQGLTVYGNKGSTDQHAYVQQLRDGVENFFAHFIEVLEDKIDFRIAPQETCGDYLNGFRLGTEAALTQKQRRILTITLPRLNEESLGALIALFERAVGFYASFIAVNAYDQPGVEAGKKAAAAILHLQHEIIEELTAKKSLSLRHLLTHFEDSGRAVDAFKVIRFLTFNERISSDRAILHPDESTLDATLTAND